MDTLHKASGQARSRTIYINHQNDWMLRAMFKARPDGPTSKDALADSILTGYFNHNHPELVALYQKRTDLDAEAVTTLAAKELKA